MPLGRLLSWRGCDHVSAWLVAFLTQLTSTAQVMVDSVFVINGSSSTADLAVDVHC
jgi:hypothetical protein